MATTQQLLLVDDHWLFCQCLAELMRRADDLSVVGQATRPREAVTLARRLRPEVILVSAGLADRETLLSLVRKLRSLDEASGILILGMSESDPDLMKLIEAGANGHVSRTEDLDGLLRSIDRARRGETVCSPTVARRMFSRLADLSLREREERRLDSLRLTFRELEILRLMAQGLTNREIAERLIVSIHTVKNHVHNILGKLEVHRRGAAVAEARVRRWL